MGQQDRAGLEDELGEKYNVCWFPFLANSWAKMNSNTEGQVKFLVEETVRRSYLNAVLLRLSGARSEDAQPIVYLGFCV